MTTEKTSSYWKHKLPAGFEFYLERLGRRVIKAQPENIPEFAATYFQAKLQERNDQLANLPAETYLQTLRLRKCASPKPLSEIPKQEPEPQTKTELPIKAVVESKKDEENKTFVKEITTTLYSQDIPDTTSAEKSADAIPYDSANYTKTQEQFNGSLQERLGREEIKTVETSSVSPFAAPVPPPKTKEREVQTDQDLTFEIPDKPFVTKVPEVKEEKHSVSSVYSSKASTEQIADEVDVDVQTEHLKTEVIEIDIIEEEDKYTQTEKNSSAMIYEKDEVYEDDFFNVRLTEFTKTQQFDKVEMNNDETQTESLGLDEEIQTEMIETTDESTQTEIGLRKSSEGKDASKSSLFSGSMIEEVDQFVQTDYPEEAANSFSETTSSLTSVLEEDKEIQTESIQQMENIQKVLSSDQQERFIKKTSSSLVAQRMREIEQATQTDIYETDAETQTDIIPSRRSSLVSSGSRADGKKSSKKSSVSSVRSKRSERSRASSARSSVASVKLDMTKATSQYSLIEEVTIALQTDSVQELDSSSPQTSISSVNKQPIKKDDEIYEKIKTEDSNFSALQSLALLTDPGNDVLKVSEYNNILCISNEEKLSETVQEPENGCVGGLDKISSEIAKEKRK